MYLTRLHTPKLYSRLIIISLILLFILLFEWANISEQLSDQSFLETGIHVDSTLTVISKKAELQEIYKTENQMENSLLVIKCLIVVFTVILIASIYYNVVLPENEDKAKNKNLQ